MLIKSRDFGSPYRATRALRHCFSSLFAVDLTDIVLSLELADGLVNLRDVVDRLVILDSLEEKGSYRSPVRAQPFREVWARYRNTVLLLF